MAVSLPRNPARTPPKRKCKNFNVPTQKYSPVFPGLQLIKSISNMDVKELAGQHTIETSVLVESDIEQLRPILEQHVKDRNTGRVLLDEIAEIESLGNP